MTRSIRHVALGLALCLLPITTLAQEPAAPQRSIGDVLGITAPPADHETHVPGPPYIACQCTTNPVRIEWAPDTRRVAQPEAYHMYVGSAPGQADLGVYNMGLATSWSGYVQPGVNYYVHIRAVNSFGGNFSAQVIVSVGNPAPQLVATVSGRTLTVWWTGSPTAYLFYSNRADFATNAYVVVSGNVATFSPVPPGVYDFLLWNGQWSNPVTVTVF